MSFNFEFNAKSAEDAQRLLDGQYAPYSVKQFVSDALRGLPGAVHVKAIGHLFDGSSYNRSAAQIEVTPIEFATIK